MSRDEKIYGEKKSSETMLLQCSTPFLNYGCVPAILLHATICYFEEISPTYSNDSVFATRN